MPWKACRESDNGPLMYHVYIIIFNTIITYSEFAGIHDDEKTMIIPIELDPPEGDESPKKLHYLTGCSIEYDGPADVATYFEPTISSEDTKERGDEQDRSSAKTAYFRGRMMKGIDVTIPPGYRLYLCQESQRDDNDDDDDDDIAEASIDEGRTGSTYRLTPMAEDHFTLWKHHVCPDKETDSTVRALEWLHLASVIHKS